MDLGDWRGVRGKLGGIEIGKTVVRMSFVIK